MCRGTLSGAYYSEQQPSKITQWFLSLLSNPHYDNYEGMGLHEFLSSRSEYNRWSTSYRKFCGDNLSFFKFFKLFQKKKKNYKSHFM